MHPGGRAGGGRDGQAHYNGSGVWEGVAGAWGRSVGEPRLPKLDAPTATKSRISFGVFHFSAIPFDASTPDYRNLLVEVVATTPQSPFFQILSRNPGAVFNQFKPFKNFWKIFEHVGVEAGPSRMPSKIFNSIRLHMCAQSADTFHPAAARSPPSAAAAEPLEAP